MPEDQTMSRLLSVAAILSLASFSLGCHDCPNSTEEKLVKVRRDL